MDRNIDIELIDIMIEKMKKSGLGKMTLAQGEFTLILEAKKEKIVQNFTSPATAGTPIEAVASAPESITGNMVKSPIVGTFYSSPTPDKPPFVTTGQKVKKGDVLFIIESMKLMNEITSDFDGIVEKIYVSNSDAVEFNQEIMVIC